MSFHEKHLSRHHTPTDVLTHIQKFGFTIYLCRTHDLENAGGGTHLVRGKDGRTIPVVPISQDWVPSQTDLLAIQPYDLIKI